MALWAVLNRALFCQKKNECLKKKTFARGEFGGKNFGNFTKIWNMPFKNIGALHTSKLEIFLEAGNLEQKKHDQNGPLPTNGVLID